MYKSVVALMLLLNFSLIAAAQNALSCKGSQTNAMATFVSGENGNITVRLDWNEGSTFAKQNLEITNGICINCPAVGGIGKNNPVQTWTIKQTDLAKPVSLAWGTESTQKYCGTEKITMNVLSCNGSKAGAKATFISNDNGNVTVRLDWNEGATFAKQNLEITNGTCINCPNVGGIGKNNPVQTWTIKQTDLAKPVSLAWGTESTKKYCGTGSLNVAPTSAAATLNALAPGKSLKENERLYSPDKSHYLVMQSDGNLCIYTSSDRFVWCSMVTTGSGCRLDMQTDGHLVVYDPNNRAVWATGTHAFHDAKYGAAEWKPVRMVLENDGALMMYNAANKPVWSSKTSDGKKL